jgi:putative hydrolase
MASNPIPGMGGFIPGLLGDLLKLLQTDGAFPFELAEQLAQSVANEAAQSANPDPVERIRLEGLLEIAELHVADVTGMSTTASGRPITIAAVNRAEWARRLLVNNRSLFERIAEGLKPAPTPPSRDTEIDDADEDAQAAAFLAKWTGAIAPAMVAMQFGSLVGHVARRTLGQYALPIPGAGVDELSIVTENLSEFADDWSIPIDDLRLAVLVRDVTTHAILSRPHVRSRLVDLLARHAEGLQPSPGALEERLGEASGTDVGDISSLMALLGDPSALGELIDTPEFRQIRAELGALGATISGYVEWVSDAVGTRAIGTTGTIREALRRSRVARAEEDRGSDVLFSELTTQIAIDRGEAFVRGVLERGGEADLAKLWVVEENLPTPAEVDAPGLWLERIDLPALEVPDDMSGFGESPEA